MSLQTPSAFSRVNTAEPNALVAWVPDSNDLATEQMAMSALYVVRQWMPKISGAAARGLQAVAEDGYYGISWGHSYVKFLEIGTKPRTMRSLAGKAQPLDEPVLTPSGWTIMGDLRLGDQVVGSDGKPTSVIGIFPQGVKDSWRVTFSDGTSVRACGDHLWSAYRDGNTRAYANTPQIVTTKQMARAGGKRGVRVWSVPLVAPVAGPDTSSPLPLDPYLLGVMLSEGCRGSSPTFSQKQLPVVDEVRRVLPEGVSLNLTTQGRSWTLTAGPRGNTYNPISRALRELGLVESVSSETGVRECPECGVSGTKRGPFASSRAVLIHSGKAHGTRVPPRGSTLYGHYSYDKFIPDAVMKASLDDRLSVLQGLMDGDGSCPVQGGVNYHTSSQRLAVGVCELVRSLGARAKVRSQRMVRDGAQRIMHTVYFNMPEGLIPFRAHLPLKRLRYLASPRRWATRKTVVSVERCGYEEMQCIQVSAEDSLYVTTGYTLTHNTIPMWVDDADGRQAAKMNPRDRQTRSRVTEDGRKQVLIFRKAAPLGSRKTIMRGGRQVSVPRSYPGAPGRIQRRDEFGKIAQGNVGVRWRHPGTQGRDYIADAILYVADSVGIRVSPQMAVVSRHTVN